MICDCPNTKEVFRSMHKEDGQLDYYFQCLECGKRGKRDEARAFAIKLWGGMG